MGLAQTLPNEPAGICMMYVCIYVCMYYMYVLLPTLQAALNCRVLLIQEAEEEGEELGEEGELPQPHSQQCPRLQGGGGRGGGTEEGRGGGTMEGGLRDNGGRGG